MFKLYWERGLEMAVYAFLFTELYLLALNIKALDLSFQASHL